MADLRTPLMGVAFTGRVTITETGPLGMITLRGDLSAAPLRAVVRAVCGTDMPDRGGMAFADGQGAAWMSPDEALLLLPRADVAGALARIATDLAGLHHLAVDMSDARALFRLEGAAIRDVLARLTPADVSPAALSPGTVRRTRLAQVPAAFWLDDAATAHVLCFRSVAQYVFDLLANAARPGGAPGVFDR